MSYELNKHDIYDFASSMQAETTEDGDELRFKYCPYCRGGANNDKNSFSINLVKGTYNCFRSSCAQHGHFVELCRDFGYRLPGLVAAEYRTLPQPKGKIIPKPNAIAYLVSRGISQAVAEQYEITVHKDFPNILVFPFFDETGWLTCIKYRNTKFRKGVDKNKEWFEKMTLPILFGMKQCEDFSRLVITEGQMDSLSLAEAGIKNAVSVPTGANGMKWLQVCKEWLLKFDEIVVFGDYEKGHITVVDALRAGLKDKQIKCVRPIDYLGEKDANDILMKYGKGALIKAVEKAEYPNFDVVKDLSTVEAVDINDIDKIKTGIREIDRTIGGGMMVGSVILITGKRGEGKSTLMSQMICSALDEGETVFAYSGELPNYFFKNWLDTQLCGSHCLEKHMNEYGDYEYTVPASVTEKINQWYKGRMYIYDNSYVPEDPQDELNEIPKVIERVISQYGARLICVDNLMSAMEDMANADNLNFKQSRFVGELKKIAIKFNVVIILIAHPRKSNGEITNDDVSGSADITNKVDVTMNYCRADKITDEDGNEIKVSDNEMGKTKLTIMKNRANGKLRDNDNPILLAYSKVSRRVNEVTADYTHYGWEDIGKTDKPVEIPVEEKIKQEYKFEDDLPF